MTMSKAATVRTRFSAWARWAAIVVTAAGLIAGCGKKDDPIAQAEKKDVAKGVAAPSIAATKAIAEEGFIFGLPLVMNYAVMNEFAVDPKVLIMEVSKVDRVNPSQELMRTIAADLAGAPTTGAVTRA